MFKEGGGLSRDESRAIAQVPDYVYGLPAGDFVLHLSQPTGLSMCRVLRVFSLPYSWPYVPDVRVALLSGVCAVHSFFLIRMCFIRS